MSSFNCEHCGAPIIDTPNGYATGCIHYPPDDFVDRTCGNTCCEYCVATDTRKENNMGSESGIESRYVDLDAIERENQANEIVAFVNFMQLAAVFAVGVLIGFLLAGVVL